jgi:lysyl-tRNA synthetase, class II
MDNAQPTNQSFSSIETQRELRIEKMNTLKSLGFDPYPVVSNRDFSLDFISFWFDFVHKHDFPGRIYQMQQALDPVLESNSDVVISQLILHEAFEETNLQEAEEYTLEWIETHHAGNSHLKENYETYIVTRRQIIADIRTFLNEKEAYSKTSITSHFQDFIKHADIKGEHKPAFTKDQTITLAGRIKAKRVSGKIAFGVVEDESLPAGFQFLFKSDLVTGSSDSLSFEQFVDLVDEGDYIQASGTLDYSRTGQPSLFVSSLSILTKALRPLPETWEEENLESRYLDRVVDFKKNTIDKNGLSVRDIMRKKAQYWSIWRDEMKKEGVLEVECPVFESIPGGAEAKPFSTFYNELDQEMYLRISLELPLKKLIAGGFEAVYEIGRVFRNEGSSPQHLQEYTQIEWYIAYKDYSWAMEFTKRVYQRVVMELLGTMKQTDYHGKEINWGEWCSKDEADKNGWKLVDGWPQIPYFDAVRYFSDGKIDTMGKTDEELVSMCNSLGIMDVKIADGTATLLDKLWKKARVNTVHPFFLVLPPVELEPLAKRDPQNPKLTQRFQVVAGGAELGKAFSELNDPIDQFGRFEHQQKARDEGNDEAQFMDKAYVEAMEYGMPPMAGFGTSERFVSFLLGKHIKECVTFPHVRNKMVNDTKNEEIVT